MHNALLSYGRVCVHLCACHIYVVPESDTRAILTSAVQSFRQACVGLQPMWHMCWSARSMSSDHGTDVHRQMTCTECITISEVRCKGALLSALVTHRVCFVAKLMIGQHLSNNWFSAALHCTFTSSTVLLFNPYCFKANTLCSNLFYIQSV